ncbi:MULTISPECIES: hypothetical protein [Streptomyces]|uniref:Uncharacterized protein n=1 Tax=Streptomyces lonegramiae TaxID=3075524 RepID=A0ABU2XUB9_9ACTN|nr:hypothetical protein [Streptomyces sp. DSM 41529]MDT0548635.1 hypothetical protein [Streptomyces sp. DSM 41529]
MPRPPAPSRQSILDIATRLLELITEERGLVTFVSNFADVAVDAFQRFSDSAGADKSSVQFTPLVGIRGGFRRVGLVG